MPRNLYNEETVLFSVRLPKTLRDALEKFAKRERRSVNQALVILLERALPEVEANVPKGKQSSR